MAEPAVDFLATNLFGLAAAFQTQSSTTDEPSNNPTAMDEAGNVACEKVISDIISYTQNAMYCDGGGADFIGDLATLLTEFGNVQSDKLVDSITIGMTPAGYATIDINGHNHAVSPHEAGLPVGHCDMSDFFPHEIGEAFYQWDGFGIPDFGITLGTGATPNSASVTLSFRSHVDKTDEQGDHFVGKNVTPKAELTMDFAGTPTSSTKTLLNADFAANTNLMLGAVTDDVNGGDSNTDYDTFALVAHAYADLATV